MVILHAGHVPFAAHHHRPLFSAYARRARTIYCEMGSRGAPHESPRGEVEVVRLRPRLPGSRFAWVVRRNWRIGLRGLVQRLRSEGVGPIVLIVQTPGLVDRLGGVGADLTAYLIVDDYAGLAPEAESARVARLHEACLRDADLVWAISEPLLEAARRLRPDILPTTTGVDQAAFESASRLPAAPSVAALPSPRVGMAGNLNDRIDWDLLEALARARPGWSFAVVGPLYLAGAATEAAVERLRALPNVRFTGGVAPEDLPAMIAGFDVGLVLYRPGAGTLGINPLKLYQYLAAGKPVVATPLPVFAGLADVVRTAADAPAMLPAIEAALAEAAADPGGADRRRRRARAFDWEVIAADRHAALERALAGGRE